MTIFDSVLIQFTLACVITILDNTKYCYCNLRQVLQLTTTVITIYDRSRYNTSHLGSLSINDGDGHENVT